MKNYDVVITETLQRTVQIEANDRDEAEQIAKECNIPLEQVKRIIEQTI